MRIVTAVFLTFSLLSAGCEALKRKTKDPIDPPVNVGQQGTPSAANLVNYLNQQADRLTVIETSDMSVVSHVQGRRMPGLTGFMVCEKPRNFRLTAEAFGADYVDIGSNNDQFWFWVKDGDAPLYYCSYTDFDRGVRLPLPFQPEWVVQALGMAKYNPNGNYRVEQKGNTFELIEETTLQGQPARKITVFNARTVSDPQQPQVIAHIVQDARGKTICQASVKRMRVADYNTRQGAGRIAYPSEIVLEWPEHQLSMTMKIGKATLNQPMSQQQSQNFFTLKNNDGRRRVDLAQLRPGNPTGRINQAGGFP